MLFLYARSSVVELIAPSLSSLMMLVRLVSFCLWVFFTFEEKIKSFTLSMFLFSRDVDVVM